MRTDSLRLSDEALNEAAAYIKATWGDRYAPDAPRHYKTKKGAQDGHEAIRPTTIPLTPDSIRGSLTSDQYKLYKLIWERFIACQMSNCLQATTQADISAGQYLFKASGYTVTFDGFTVLYEEAKDETEDAAAALPPLEKDMPLRCKEVLGNQHFTQPPARYTEATLIKALEENGIGRPSTYAATISTITGREYVTRESKALKPTELGEVATQLMKDKFPKIVNVKFTAQMETNLDKVEEGNVEWQDSIRDFYTDFEQTLKDAKASMEGVKLKLTEEETDFICEKCGKRMIIKTGRFGKFIACPGYPECKNIKSIVIETGADCPKCGGKVIEKKSKRGRVFYGCANYPNCDFVSWNEPVNDKCPQCGHILYRKKGKVPKLFCAEEGCGYSRNDTKEEEA
jgi:DNA topoisomerase-1